MIGRRRKYLQIYSKYIWAEHIDYMADDQFLIVALYFCSPLRLSPIRVVLVDLLMDIFKVIAGAWASIGHWNHH